MLWLHSFSNALVLHMFLSCSIAASAPLSDELLEETPLELVQALNLTVTPSLPEDFHIRGVGGRDRINGLDAYMNGLLAAQELGLRDFDGIEAAREFSYPGHTSVRIRIRGRPASRFQRKYALWGIASTLGFMTDQRRFMSATFTLLMGGQAVGEVVYIARNPAPSGIEPMIDGIDNEAGNTTYSPDGTADGMGLTLPTQKRTKLRTRQTLIDSRGNTSLSYRPGHLVVEPTFTGRPVGIGDFFVIAIGGLVYAASQGSDSQLINFDVEVQGVRTRMLVVNHIIQSTLPFYIKDVINGIVDLTNQARVQHKYEEVRGSFYWINGEQRADLGRMAIYNGPAPGLSEGANRQNETGTFSVQRS